MSATNTMAIGPNGHGSTESPARQVGPETRLTPAPYFRWKGVLDRVVAALLLLPGLPMIGGLLLLVRLTSRGPGIYRQVRVGKNGRLFRMYKIRTMRCDAEAKTGPVWTKARDPRITRIGRVLRKLHLDELPQLFNVLRGEMSLIGPRPERPEFVEVLAEQIPGYLDRLLVCPGVTGLAQVNFAPDTDLNSVRRKLVLDLQYIAGASPLLDMRLFVCTSGRMFKISLVRVLGLRRRVTLPEAAPRMIELGGQESPPLEASARSAGGNGNGNGHGNGNGNGHCNGTGGNGNGNGAALRNGKKRRGRKGRRGVRPR
jgi:lipopolysaccharide/colanic/teichoic acid biosynthesis glycosyltransferase